MISLFFLHFLLNSWERYLQSSLFSLLLLKNKLWSIIRFAHLVNIQINSFFCVFYSTPFSNILLNLDSSIKSDLKVYKHFHQIMFNSYFRFKDLFSEYFKISNFPQKPKNINQIKTSQFLLSSSLRLLSQFSSYIEIWLTSVLIIRFAFWKREFGSDENV